MHAHMAHMLQITQSRSNLIEGVFLLLRLLLDLLPVLVCTSSRVPHL